MLYAVNGRHIAEIDCVPGPYGAWTLVDQGSLDLRGIPELQERAQSAVRMLEDGSVRSKYPPGSSLAAVPFFLLYPLTGTEPDLSHSAMARLGKWVAASYAAGVAVLVYLLCQRLAPGGALAAALFVGAGTTLWSTASQALWSHGPATFFVCGALFCLARRTEGPRPLDALLAGTALGLALLCRPSTALFAAASATALVADRHWREGALTLVPVVLLGMGLIAYNHIHFDAPIAGGYLNEAQRFDGALTSGLSGLLTSPSRGILVYSPALWLLPFGLQKLRGDCELSQSQRRLLIGWMIGALVTLLLYARWYVWWGGWSFGPRFLTETVPVLGVVVALAYEQLGERFGRSGRALAWGLIALSIAVHFVGVFGHGSDWMVGKLGTDMFALGDTQIAAHARYLWTERPAALLLPLSVVVWALGRSFARTSRPTDSTVNRS